MTTYISQQDSNGVDDTYLSQVAPTTNYGSLTTKFIVGYRSAGEVYRAAIRFDLSKGTNPPPRGSVVTAVGFVLYCQNCYGTRTHAIYQCLRPWVEAEATWNIWKTGSGWTIAGAGSNGNDYSSTLLASVSVFTAGQYSFSVETAIVAVVQGWVNGTIENDGFIMRVTDESGGHESEFTPSEGATAANRPQLYIEYLYPSLGIIGPFFKEQKEKAKKYWQGWSLKNGIFQPQLGLQI